MPLLQRLQVHTVQATIKPKYKSSFTSEHLNTLLQAETLVKIHFTVSQRLTQVRLPERKKYCQGQNKRSLYILRVENRVC